MKTLSAPPLRTTFVLPSLSPGGAERVLIMLMNGLDKTRFAPSLISLIAKNGLSDMVQQDIPTRCLNQKGVLCALAPLYRALKAERPDIVISTMAHMNFAVLILKPFFPKTKFIIREAITPSYFLDKKCLRAVIISLAYRVLYRHADLVICPSQIILNEFHTRLGIGINDCRYVLLYNPVDLQKIRDSAQPPNRREDKIRFIASGRLHRQKGFDRLIESLKDFDPGQPWSLDILGEGEQRAELEQLIARNGLEDKIVMRGHTSNPWQYYAGADCLLLSSRWEGMPNVALESLACGTPVIAMREAGGIGEIANKIAPENIKLASSMDEFVCIMEKTGRKANGEPLLPNAFSKETVQSAFSDMIMNVAGTKR